MFEGRSIRKGFKIEDIPIPPPLWKNLNEHFHFPFMHPIMVKL